MDRASFVVQGRFKSNFVEGEASAPNGLCVCVRAGL